jgi:hypothetical protein
MRASVRPAAAVAPDSIVICETVTVVSGVKNEWSALPLVITRKETAIRGKVSTAAVGMENRACSAAVVTTLLLSLASASVPLVRSEADVVAIPPPEVPTST